MRHTQTTPWIVGVAAIACLGAALSAAPVNYQGTAIITTDTSNAAFFPLGVSDLGFADGTNLQGLTVTFSLTFDDASFDPDLQPNTSLGQYIYNGVSTYSYQVAGGNLVTRELRFISIFDNLPNDQWSAFSPATGLTQGGIQLEAPDTLFNDDTLRTLIDPADFTVLRRFTIIGDPINDGWAADAIIEEMTRTVIPLPAAAAAGLVLLGGLLTRRTRR